MRGCPSPILAIAGVAFVSGVAIACGLSTTGTGAVDPLAGNDAPLDAAAAGADGAILQPMLDAAHPSSDASSDGSTLDAATDSSGAVVPRCPVTTASAFSLASFAEKGTATKVGASVQLTSNADTQAGAAWYDSAFTAAPQGLIVNLAFTEKNGANNAIDGGFAIVFLAAPPPQTLPNVGGAGTSFGACGIGGTGFAVVVDVTSNVAGTNGDSVKIVDVSNCKVLAGVNFGGVNSNTPYSVTINFNAGNVTASFLGANVTTSVAVPSPMFFGVTASTGTQPCYWSFTGATGTFAGCP